MASISWCMKQKQGILLSESSDNLCTAYLKEADETLHVMLGITGRWKVITAYYACYHALYALLQKAGITSEIHDCTIALMSLFDFTKEQTKFMLHLKEERINVQYYLQAPKTIDEAQVKLFVADCKSKTHITADQISVIQSTLKVQK